MKSRIPLKDFVPHLPANLRDGLGEALKDTETEPELHRAVAVADLATDGGGVHKTFVGYASTRSVDRDGEVVLPGGMDLTQFRKAPVLLWGHKWSEPPIGKDEAIENDGYGIKTRSLLAETALATDIWQLVKAKMLNTSSIGYIPMEWVLPDHKDYGGLMDLARGWPEWQKNAEPTAFVTRSILLEHSLVSVPANIDALILGVKQFNLTEIAKSLPRVQREPTMPVVAAPPVAPATPKTFVPRLVKTAEQLQVEWQTELLRCVTEELQRRMGRV